LDREDSSTDSFAERLNLALGLLNLSRGQLAQAVGVDKSVVSRWASGNTEPTAYNLARISEVLAKERPGFNMTLWDKPRSEFEAFLGIESGAPTAVPEDAPAPTNEENQSYPTHLIFGAAILVAVLAAASAFLLLRSGDTTEKSGGKFPQEASIAVLPFINMSGDTSKDFLSDGFSEELLNDLANTPQLRVAARTSSFQFKGKRVDIHDVAQRLDVRTVLEGSVREAGDHIRITAQLIDATSGYHLWSQTYDRQLTDVLKVQSEISHAIAAALIQKLLAKRSTAQSTIDPDAYRKFLLGKTLFAHDTPEDTDRAIVLFRDTTSLQPDFADGYAMLAYAYLHKDWRANDPRSSEAVIQAAVARALALDPHNITALLVSMDVALEGQDWVGSARFLARLQQTNPRQIYVARAAGQYYRALGFPQRSLEAYELAARLDPLSPPAWGSLAIAYGLAGRRKDAVAAGQTALSLAPNSVLVLAWVCLARNQIGDIAEARRLAARLAQTAEGRELRGCEMEIALKSGDLAKARAIVEQRARDHAGGPAFIGQNFLEVGLYDKALRALRYAYDVGDVILYTLPLDPETPRDFLKSPGWIALTQLPRFRAWQAAHDRVANLEH